MSAWEIIIIVCAAALVAFTIIFNVVRILKGKGSSCCSGTCSGECACCSARSVKTKKVKK